ncbi:leucine-rich repeat domain-containing protein [Suttonella ornithocola]|uniref:Uncharacterized protein n=1 Tax=Suttonella ornithocola TaxID=279832 RepID=A0A380N0D5_9GAMM|nr:leucine-rich repeat domain-containing protein [Suttonella ornithocola]SUO97583.1 Uncharacterised protein [Suttonella ornithocola]
MKPILLAILYSLTTLHAFAEPPQTIAKQTQAATTLPSYPESLIIENSYLSKYDNLMTWAKVNNIPETVIPNDYYTLTQLKALSLRGYHLPTVPKELSILKKLSALDLSDNQLTNVDFLSDLPELNYLNIAINQISELENFEDNHNDTLLFTRYNLATFDDSTFLLLFTRYTPADFDDNTLLSPDKDDHPPTSYTENFTAFLNRQYPMLLALINESEESDEEKQASIEKLPTLSAEELEKTAQRYYQQYTQQIYNQVTSNLSEINSHQLLTASSYHQLAEELYDDYQNKTIGNYALSSAIKQAIETIGERAITIPEYYDAAITLSETLEPALQKVAAARWRYALSKAAVKKGTIGPYKLSRSALTLTYQLLFTQKPEDLEEIITLSEQAEKQTPNYLPLYTNHAHALALLGKTEAARELYNRYIDAVFPFPEGDITWVAAVIDDIETLKAAGIRNDLLNTILRQYVFYSGLHRIKSAF